MFENIQPGQTVTIHFSGSTQGLAQRVRYEGELSGTHHFAGIGVMADVHLSAERDGSRWVLSNGRTLTDVRAV